MIGNALVTEFAQKMEIVNVLLGQKVIRILQDQTVHFACVQKILLGLAQ